MSSKAAISYDSLEDASGRAEKAASKFADYSDSLSGTVYNKLSSYAGESSSYLSSAKSSIKSKVSALDSQESKYEAYAKSLSELKDECVSADKAVRTRITSLAAIYKEANGIKISAAAYVINSIILSGTNSTLLGRAFNSAASRTGSELNEARQIIKKWFYYEGGKEFVIGVASAVLGIAVAVLGLISGFGVLALIGAVIAVVNGVTSIIMEKKALSAASDDPATARRLSSVDSLSDYLRSSFIFDDSGEVYEYNKFYNAAALGLDIANAVVSTLQFFKGVGNMFKNVYKWATGAVKGSWTNFFSKATFSGIKTKVLNLGTSIKINGWSYVKTLGLSLVSDFGTNLKNKFFTFSSGGSFSIKKTSGSLKSMLSVAKTFVTDDLSISDVANVAIFQVGFSGITVFSVNTEKVSVTIEVSGQLAWNTTENITLSSVSGLLKSGKGLYKTGISLFSDNSAILNSLIQKLSLDSGENISISDISVPEFNFDLNAAAA